MLQQESIKAKWHMSVLTRVKDYSQLLKPNLSFMVVFSSVIGYLLAPGIQFDLKKVVMLFIGGVLVTGSANTINQIIERYSDALMKRTMMRPMPDGRMGTPEAWAVAVISAVVGTSL